ncbi:elongation factor P [Devosia sp. RR2S18]|jgi:elongation factor P|uniref:elongation factor P n=1 Tax=Devosia rhizosphaerae TaxID=3049774 RepID=UPI0025416640|nr:elongation factor P [Devosia sp. RR2S18]WIJ26041.1 elongation factor P [Devosia sp. RR2S18]HEV7292610.1 elongation factor P [Devosia sp.]
MAKINGNEIRPGFVLNHQDRLWVAVKVDHVKPGKGGAYAQVELRAILGGTKLNERFRSAETVEQVELEFRDFTFLYEQGDQLVFMDQESYEQVELDKDFVGERAAFLQDGMKITLEMHETTPLGVRFPPNVVLEVIEADPVIKGQTAASSFKSARVANGLKVMVPPFVAVGERIVVDTTEATYLRRAE